MRRHIALPRGPIHSHKIPKMKFFWGDNFKNEKYERGNKGR